MPKEEDTNQGKSSISKASSYEEIGEFWDTHSITDYWEQTYPVEFTIKLSKVETLESWQDTQITEQMSEDLGKRSLSPTVEL
ncbi:MAG: hypothetical protein U7127_25280 [Phormidium sp.]